MPVSHLKGNDMALGSAERDLPKKTPGTTSPAFSISGYRTVALQLLQSESALMEG
jgi:hypothetical protein